jgi:hypothetical protein
MKAVFDDIFSEIVLSSPNIRECILYTVIKHQDYAMGQVETDLRFLRLDLILVNDIYERILFGDTCCREVVVTKGKSME